MHVRTAIAVSLLSLQLVDSLFAQGSEEPSVDPAGIEFFESKIRPILLKYCYECHSTESKNIKGGLLLDSREASHQGGDSGPAVVPKNDADSLLMDALRYDGFEMPPKGKLPDARDRGLCKVD